MIKNNISEIRFMVNLIKHLLPVLPLFLMLNCSQNIADSTAELPEQNSEVPESDADMIPDFIIQKSNQIVMTLVGDEFFGQHYLFDTTRSQYYEADQWCIDHPSGCLQFLQYPHYLIVYSLQLDDTNTENSFAEFVLDGSGNLVTEREVYGIPDCLNDPGECVFIDKASAISIANDAGLEAGLRDWRVNFSWFARGVKTFVWTISNTLTETGPPEYSSSGRTVIIDANSGKVIEIVNWQAIS